MRRALQRCGALAGPWLLIALFWLCPAVLEGQQTDTEVKAEYLYRLIQFTEWPPGVFGQGEAVHICSASDDAFIRVLTAVVQNRTAGGRAVQARHVETNEQTRACHVLFVGDIGRTRIETFLRAVAGTPVLTVSDTPAFLSQGGMIRFVRQGTRIRFEVDLTAAREANLTFSATLLQAASDVRSRR